MTPPATDDPQARRWFWLILLAGLIVVGAGIGLRDPWPSDEPRYTLVAKQMIASGDWLFPHRGSELYSDKPPMLMWLEALSYRLTGHWRIAFLLPSLLAVLGTLALTHDIARRLWSPRAGLFAMGLLLASFQFVYQGKRAQIDPLVMFLITLSNWALVRHLLLGPDWRAWWLGCFAAGLGVITKGVGVIALLMLLPYLLALRLGWSGVARTAGASWRWAGGALAFLAAIALWLVPMVSVALWKATPEHLAYMHDILFQQTVRRYAGSVGGHEQPFWYFVPVLLLHFFPMVLAYPSALRDWYGSLSRQDARLLLLLGWCALVFLFFSAAGGKREVYLMPMMPILAVALAPTVQRIHDRAWLRWTAFALTMAAGAGLLLAAWRGLQGRWASMATMIAERELPHDGRDLWWMMLAMGAAFLLAGLLARPRRGLHGLLAGMAGFWLIWGLWGSILLNDANSAAGVMRKAGALAGAQGEIALVAWKEQNLLMADRPMKDFGFLRDSGEQFVDAARWAAADPGRRWIFGLREAVAECVQRDKAVVVGWANRRQWWMFRAEAILPDCRPRWQEQADAKEEGG